LLEKACTAGDMLSCESLGGLEAGADGSKPSPDLVTATRRAAVYYRRACDLGSANGCAFVAVFIAEKLITGTAREALELYVKACSRGHEIACRQGAEFLNQDTREWKAVAATLDVARLTADLLSRGCKQGDAKSCAQAEHAP